MNFHIFLLISIVCGCSALFGYDPLGAIYNAGSASLGAVGSTVEDVGSAALNAGSATLGGAEDVGSALVDAGGSTLGAVGSTLGDVGTTIGNVGTSIYEHTTGVLAKLPDLIPSPAALFALTKNAIAEVAFSAINLVCK